MSTIKKGVAGATAGVGVGRRAAAAKVEKTPAPKTAPTTTGRVLRKRT